MINILNEILSCRNIDPIINIQYILIQKLIQKFLLKEQKIELITDQLCNLSFVDK